MDADLQWYSDMQPTLYTDRVLPARYRPWYNTNGTLLNILAKPSYITVPSALIVQYCAGLTDVARWRTPVVQQTRMTDIGCTCLLGPVQNA